MTTFSSGLYIVFVLGINDINKEPLALALQLGGILISIISLTKGVAEYQISGAYQKESNFFAVLASMVFILPHTLVRVISYSLIAAFLKYYAAIPAAILLITNTILALVSFAHAQWAIAHADADDDDDHPTENAFYIFVNVFAGLCAPLTVCPPLKEHFRYLRRSLLSTNLLIMTSLLFLKFLPGILPPSVLVKTPGLEHLNFESITSGAHNATSNATGPYFSIFIKKANYRNLIHSRISLSSLQHNRCFHPKF